MDALSATPLRRPRLDLGVGPQLVVLALVLGLAGAMAIQPTRQLLAQRARIEQMTADLRRTERANERLEAYITRLNDPDYIEQQARAELGLVRPGETVYVVMPPERRRRAGRAHEPRRAGREERSYLERVLDFIGLP